MRSVRVLGAIGAGLCFGSICFDSTIAHAYPLNPWGGLTGKGALAVTPFLYYYPQATFSPYVYLGYGVSDKLDVMVGAGGTLDGAAGAGSFDLATVYGRYFLNESLGLVGHVTWYSGGALELAPEIHYVKSWDKLALTVNAGYYPSLLLGGGGFDPGSVKLWIAPEYTFSPQCSVFLEINPGLALDGSNAVGLQVVPGVGFSLDADQSHVFSVGLQLDLSPGTSFSANSISAGVWYSHAFGGE